MYVCASGQCSQGTHRGRTYQTFTFTRSVYGSRNRDRNRPVNSMNTQEVRKLYDEYVLPTYHRTGICIVKGKGSKVWDLEGKEYLDFFPGWAVSGLGHCHPSVVNAIKHQARKILHVSNNFPRLMFDRMKIGREHV